MSNEVNELIKAKNDSATVAYQRFVLLTNPCPNSLFCFFENKDAPYYHHRIKTYYNGEAHYIKCGNKSMVLKVYNLINKQKLYKKYLKAFFIDRDYDKSVKNKYKEVYETPCYSIENLYCSCKSIEELIKTDFQISLDMPEYQTILNLYSKLSEEFLQASLLFNAWYKLQKEKFKTGQEQNKICLTESLIPNYIQITLTEVKSNYNLDKILIKFPNSIPISEIEIKRKIKKLRKSDLLLSLRGKYVFNFMIYFIRLLIEDGSKRGNNTILKNKIKYNVDKTNALTMLTCYAETPECLVEFLKQYN